MFNTDFWIYNNQEDTSKQVYGPTGIPAEPPVINFNLIPPPDEIVFNDAGENINFRVEGVNNPTLFNIDASTSNVSVNGNFIANSVNNGPLAGFRNIIINGSFDFWQRGTSFTGTQYGADRWMNSAVGTACTMSRQTFGIGQTDVPGFPTYFCRVGVTSVAGNNNYAFIEQRIENVNTFNGEEIAVSFWAKANVPKNISISLLQFFGTGGTPSGTISGIGATKVGITTTWEKVEVLINVPSTAGKFIGTNLDDSLRLRIHFDAGSNETSETTSLGRQSGIFDLAQVQVERGPVATPFEMRPKDTEFSLCKRYYLAIAEYSGALTTAIFSVGGAAYFSVEGLNNLRSIPSINIIAYSFLFFNGTSWVAQGTGVSFSVYTNFTNMFYKPMILLATGLSGNGSLSTPTAFGAFGYLSAEI